MKNWSWIAAIVAVWPSPTMARAASVDQDAAAAEVQCKNLGRRDFSATRDAPFETTVAEGVPATATARSYCKVEGQVFPQISFELRLPLTGWNGGFMLVGSGGWATEKFLFLCQESLRRGYACLAGDGGHQQGRGLWMRGNPQARIDWGYRATHVTTLAGKALVEAFYGKPPERSLILGTSTGGYQALVEAQRFPRDFDGIVAIAPDIDEAGLAMRTEWSRRNLVDQDGRSLFTPSDLQLLHRGALTACDGPDGLRDGIIGDALGCRFDPQTLACKGGEATGCLSAHQVTAASRIYAGPTTSRGERLAAGGLLPGSELGWMEIARDTMPDEFFRSALADLPGDGFPAASFDFKRDHERLGLAATAVSSNPDLRRFKQAGGKLLLVQGANDVVEQPAVLVDYYQTVERVIGGAQETRQFARLFVVPGMNHSTGGDGAFAIDYLTAIERWVVQNRAPDMLVGAHVPDWRNGNRGLVAGLTGPNPGQKVTFTRPIFPYPVKAKYRGYGDPNIWQSFHAWVG